MVVKKKPSTMIAEMLNFLSVSTIRTRIFSTQHMSEFYRITIVVVFFFADQTNQCTQTADTAASGVYYFFYFVTL